MFVFSNQSEARVVVVVAVACLIDLRQACHFKLPGAIEAIKKSLTLIWRTEETIESEIKQAFVKVIASFFLYPSANW